MMGIAARNQTLKNKMNLSPEVKEEVNTAGSETLNKYFLRSDLWPTLLSGLKVLSDFRKKN